MDNLIQKLNILKEVKPSASWKESNRRILLAQISTSKELEIHKGFFSIIHQPAWAVFCILLIVVAGGGFSAHATKNIKPGNSLFIARVVSEKAQLAMTFNKEKRAKLDMKLAQNRAKEITEVMSNPKFDHEDKKKVQKLAQNFRNDINKVKTSLVEINKIKEESAQEESENKSIGLGGITREGGVYAVESGRDDAGMDFHESDFKIGEEKLNEEVEAIIKERIIPPVELKNTSTKEALVEATSTVENVNTIIEDSLELAEETFEAKNFEETKNILREVGEIIENIDNVEDEGEVKGVEEEVFPKTDTASTS